MDIMKRGNEKEFNFIQEKVVSRRKHRIKRFLFSVATTLILAVIFGFVARIVFIKSDSIVFQLLGLDELKRQQILFPSNGPDDTGAIAGLTPTPNPTISVAPTVTEKLEDEENRVEEKPKPTIIEQKIDATIIDLQTIYGDIKELAGTLQCSLTTITAVESGVDWFNDEYEKRKSTTGIVIGENSVDVLVLTNLDNVESADNIEVEFYGGITVPGVLWNYDKDYNLAVIAVELKNIPEEKFEKIKSVDLGESYPLAVGDFVLALGSPNGYTGSMEIGMVTSKGSTVYVTGHSLDLFYTDITDTPQSSGIIVNISGEVVGIITQSLKEDKDSNISTAIGITKLKPIINALANKTDRIYFGIQGMDIPDSFLEEEGIENGIYVTEVHSNSPAFEAEIYQGDIITAVNNIKVISMNGFNKILNSHKVGDKVVITVQRKSKQVLKEIQLEVILQKKVSRD